jgi:hypothetical protein
MATRTASIPVVSSGDGPQVAISDLVGQKTVVLSGFFQGSYTLLATHDGSDFAPVLLFNTDGQEKIVLTLSEAYSAVKLRTNANTTGMVTASISGVSVPGQNSFVSFPPIPAGATGPQASIDTFVLVPPTGFEADINFIVSATLLTGSLVIEGSADNVNFNPVGTFTGGSVQRSLVGLPASLEFNPLPSQDIVQYYRVNVQGQLASQAIVTMGGGVPASGGGAGIPIPIYIGPTSGAPGTGFQALGQATMPPTVATGTDAVAAGRLVAAQGPDDVVIGNNLASQTDGNAILIGAASTIGHGLADICIGRQNSIADATSSTTVIGDICAINSGSDYSVAIGRQIVTDVGCTGSVAIGYQALIKATSPNAIAIGTNAQVGNGVSSGANSIALGSGSTVVPSLAIGIGDGCEIFDTSTNSQAIGDGANIATGSAGSTAIGSNATIAAHSGPSVAIGSGAGVSSTNAQALGDVATVGTGSLGAVAIGTNAIVTSAAGGAIAIGAHATIQANASEGVALGASASVASIDGLAIGGSSSIAASSDMSVAIGTSANVASLNSQALGDNATVGTGSLGSVALGSTATVTSAAGGSIAIGYAATIQANASEGIAIGASSNVATTDGISVGGASMSVGVGAIALGNTAKSYGVNSIVIGQSASDNTGATAAYAIAIGSTAFSLSDHGIAIGRTANVGTAAAGGIAIGSDEAGGLGSTKVLAPGGIAIGQGAVIPLPANNSMAFGAGASANQANEVVFGGNPKITLFHVPSSLGGVNDLFSFNTADVVNNHDTCMRLYYKNAVGTIVSAHVTVNATGQLTVPV